VGAVGAAACVDRACDDRFHDVALLHAGAGDGFFDGGHDDVADACVAPTRAAEHADAQDLPGTRVVGDSKSRLLLNHVNLLMSASSPAQARKLVGTSVTSHARGFPRPATVWWRKADGSP